MGQPYDLTSSEPCVGTLCCESPPRGPWYFQADAIFIRRDRIDPVSLQTLGNLGNVVLSTDAINAPFRAGPKVLLGHSFGETRWQIEGTYFFIDSWDDSAAVRDITNNPTPPGGQGNMFSPFTSFGHPAIPGFDYNNFVSVREFSQLRSAELNLVYTLPMPYECLTTKFIMGLRYIDIHEQFDYFTQSAVPSPLGSARSISTQTMNDLFGPQLGGDFKFFAYHQCWIDLSIKGAICDNRALQDTIGTLAYQGVDTPVVSRCPRDATAFVGDLDLSLVWQITPRFVTRIGYQALWINNIAMAARNFAPPAEVLIFGPPQIDTIGRVVYHGPHIGLEWTW